MAVDDDVLLMFVGHADDAADEAAAVKSLEPELQAELNHLLRAHDSKLRRFQIWVWSADAGYEVGGQDAIVREHLDRAKIGLFLFKHRVGAVTWHELEGFRDRKAEQVQVMAVFPVKGPDDDWNDSASQGWQDLKAKARVLTADWTAENSRSVRPLPHYRDLEQLKATVLEHVTRALPQCLRAHDQPALIPTPAARPAVERPFLDDLTTVTQFDTDATRAFRKELRPEPGLLARYPSGTSDEEFLMRAGVLREGRLTRTGVLLFTRWPDQEMVTAIVRLSQYEGDEKDAPLRREDVHGPVQVQLERAYDWVRSAIGKVDTVPGDGVRAESHYPFPMVCVRELLGNALCHRDYSLQLAKTSVTVFEDRLEISSPGRWCGDAAIPEGVAVPLTALKGGSRARNLRLAQLLASIDLLEVEGSGIARALADCAEAGAKEPEVVQSGAQVTVTVYPARRRRVLRVDVGSFSAKDLDELVRTLESKGIKLARGKG